MITAKMNLKDAIKKYRTFLLMERQLSTGTANSYEKELDAFSEHLLENYQLIKLSDVIPRHIVRYTSEARAGNRDYQNNTLQRKRSIIKSFFSFCVYDELLPPKSNPAHNIESIKVPYRKLPNIISPEQAISLIEDQEEDCIKSVIYELLYATGIRVSELINMKTEDVNFKEMYIKVCSGKGMRDRLVPIHKLCAEKLKAYLERRSNIVKSSLKAPQKLLFIQHNGKHFTRQKIHQMIADDAKKLEIQSRITPHTFRHSFATHLYENGVDLLHLRDMLGHACISTTEIYLHVSTAHLRKQLELYHPRF